MMARIVGAGHIDSIVHAHFVGCVVYWIVRAKMEHPSRVCLKKPTSMQERRDAFVRAYDT